MTSEHRHHTSGTLGLAIGLAASAGFVDAFIYTKVAPVFVANMSGNLVRLGISSGVHDWRAAAAGVVAIGSFLLGAVVATTHLDSHVRGERAPDPIGLLIAESLLLLALTGVVSLAHVGYSRSIQPIDFVVVTLGAAAMGNQAIALRRVGQVAVSTTYGTGAVVRLGEKIALSFRRAPRPDDARRRVTIAVLGAVLASYVAGAAAAAALSGGAVLLLLPSVVPLIAATLLLRRQPARD